MDITVERNAFGRQVDSFEVDLEVQSEREQRQFAGSARIHAVFIRAPLIESVLGQRQGAGGLDRRPHRGGAAGHAPGDLLPSRADRR